MKVTSLKKIRKRFSIYEKIHYGVKLFYLYDGDVRVTHGYPSISLVKYVMMDKIREEYDKYSKHYNSKGKKVWHGK
jgi:hypothetical protein